MRDSSGLYYILVFLVVWGVWAFLPISVHIECARVCLLVKDRCAHISLCLFRYRVPPSPCLLICRLGVHSCYVRWDCSVPVIRGRPPVGTGERLWPGAHRHDAGTNDGKQKTTVRCCADGHTDATTGPTGGRHRRTQRGRRRQMQWRCTAVRKPETTHAPETGAGDAGRAAL